MHITPSKTLKNHTDPKLLNGSVQCFNSIMKGSLISCTEQALKTLTKYK